MKPKGFIILAVALSCIVGVQGVEALTQGYIDSGQNGITGYGVVGATYTGSSTNDCAVSGFASASTGTVYGVYGNCNSNLGRGVFGYAQHSSGYVWGVYGQSNSSSGGGVYGIAAGTSGYNHGVYGKSDSTLGTGVYAHATSSTGWSDGVFGRSDSTSGTGVGGWATASTGTTYGVLGMSQSTAGFGVYGYAPTGSTDPGVKSFGVYGTTDSGSGRGVCGFVNALTGFNYGGLFQSKSDRGTGVRGYASHSSGINYGVYGRTNSPAGYGVYSDGRMKVNGDFTCTGTKAAVVTIPSGDQVTLYAEESSENWFADYGAAILTQGMAVVPIDPLFAQTVTTTSEYHVFLTPRGDCKGLYVAHQTPTSFTVKELKGGDANIRFSYRIVAKRQGYETERLVKVETPTKTQGRPIAVSMK